MGLVRLILLKGEYLWYLISRSSRLLPYNHWLNQNHEIII